MDEVLSAVCPRCGSPPLFMFDRQWVCGNDDCAVFCWDPAQDRAGFEATAHVIELDKEEETMNRIAIGDEDGRFVDAETGATFTGRPAAKQPEHLTKADRARLDAGDMFVVGALYEFDMPDDSASDDSSGGSD